eukprot:c16740_g2_i1.p1 GENE.c16740_g2_i1~~c16740_g2_i1.p1  ORF type:complete len:368 (+),score=56.43 c16740_g2_i1:263-1366(+)
MWLHLDKDRQRIRSVTRETLEEAIHSNWGRVTAAEFRSFVNQTHKTLLSSAPSVWPKPSGPAYGCWPSMYWLDPNQITVHENLYRSSSQSTGPAQLPPINPDRFLRMQTVRGSVRPRSVISTTPRAMGTPRSESSREELGGASWIWRMFKSLTSRPQVTEEQNILDEEKLGDTFASYDPFNSLETHERALETIESRLAIPLPPPSGMLWPVKVLGWSSYYDEGTSPKQVLGPPKVYPNYGDTYGSWAPRFSKSGPEHIELGYSRPLKIKTILIYETFNPGAVVRVSLLDPKTQEWRCVYDGEPHQLTLPPESRIFSPELRRVDFATTAVRLDLNTASSRSWSEIDAVGIVEEKEVDLPLTFANLSLD